MKKPMPFDFLLDYLPRSVIVVPAIGMFYVYLNGKIVFIFRKTNKNPHHNGIWIAADRGAQDSLKADLPTITEFVFDEGHAVELGWLLLNESGEDFETDAIRLCEMVSQNDPRIGRVTPKSKAMLKRYE
ncbi:hypothetical protein [Mucilaginibacter myungsuensis]|uniref:Uncharacterized protein n=1 Tax=Mucilaginibacter myungsuensis TaxID=649104 RepID=A0A929KY56_9SPHI|nr:hypothetical protein [Mucilaginibacter myungsuensis]MBE9662680.1 hypothetical protein [Mucilaginibacter myungsuensis]MDN3598100.1 hypothetical protein [Mucilaginibacter myungsuensis]